MKRKLIEVALPLEAINRESAREKSIRHGHPSTLHLWWARRPLAACRAVLFAQLVDDPSSHPDRFATEEDQTRERKRLFDLIERLVVWENTTDEGLMEEAREEIRRSCGGHPPPILDPFAGGGSIPLEAQRLGLEAHASDLNPVAVLINKALIEIPPKFAGRPPVFPGAAESRLGEWPLASGIAEDVRRYGQWMRDEAEKRIGHLYPKATLSDGSKATVIAWIWARTVTCPNPACGITMPLVRSWWLGKKPGKEAYVVPRVMGSQVEFTIGHDPAQAPSKDNDGTVTRAGAVCLGCGNATPLSYVRAEGKAGRVGAQLMAIAAEGKRRRIYLSPDDEHADAADVDRPEDVPDSEIPINPRYLTTPNYGMTHHADLFTNRQLIALTTFSDLVVEAYAVVLRDAGSEPYAQAVAMYLALGSVRIADRHAALTTWDSSPSKEQVRGIFARQAIAMVWDFAEGNPLGDSSGNLRESLQWVPRVIERLGYGRVGSVVQCSALASPVGPTVVSTDPPYYDNVGYADLSDLFYIWLRRSLVLVVPELVGTVLTPKQDELVADPFRQGGAEDAERFFERGFIEVFARIRNNAIDGFPTTVFYAFKQEDSDEEGQTSTGWQTLLEGMIRSGWTVTGTWPIRTELANRMRSLDSNALASSIVLACRPRDASAAATTRRALLAALKSGLPQQLREMQQGSLAPVDLAQAAIGPGMAVFSRYSRVVEADGSDMTVRTALALINQVLDEVLSAQDGDFDSDTRFSVKWFTEYGFEDAPIDRADVLARATGTSREGLVRGGIFWARAGRARLLPPGELSTAWDPLTDDRISVWEVTMRLAKAVAEQGVDAAAPLLVGSGTRVDLDACKALSYRLFATCTNKKWAQWALLFNGLGSSWLDLEHAARGVVGRAAPAQSALDYDDES